jgi:hypothetical protein
MKLPELIHEHCSCPYPTKIQGRNETTKAISSYSLFDRLQSLLVEDDNDEAEVQSMTDSSSEEKGPSGFLDEDNGNEEYLFRQMILSDYHCTSIWHVSMAHVLR